MASTSHSALPARFRPLAATMPTGRILTSPGQLAAYESDALGYKRFPPEAVAIPGSAGELKALVKALREIAIPFQVRGAGTSLSGGPVAAQGGIIIHTSRLRAIEEINTTEGYAIVESGVVLDHLNDALRPHGLFYPPDPSTGPVCTLGGNVASNAGGAYNIQKPDNAREILKRKSAFLDHIPQGVRPILATSNHVCMMQWNSARALVNRSFEVKHIIQLLDPVS